MLERRGDAGTGRGGHGGDSLGRGIQGYPGLRSGGGGVGGGCSGTWGGESGVTLRGDAGGESGGTFGGTRGGVGVRGMRVWGHTGIQERGGVRVWGVSWGSESGGTCARDGPSVYAGGGDRGCSRTSPPEPPTSRRGVFPGAGTGIHAQPPANPPEHGGPRGRGGPTREWGQPRAPQRLVSQGEFSPPPPPTPAPGSSGSCRAKAAPAPSPAPPGDSCPGVGGNFTLEASMRCWRTPHPPHPTRLLVQHQEQVLSPAPLPIADTSPPRRTSGSGGFRHVMHLPSPPSLLELPSLHQQPLHLAKVLLPLE